MNEPTEEFDYYFDIGDRATFWGTASFLLMLGFINYETIPPLWVWASSVLFAMFLMNFFRWVNVVMLLVNVTLAGWVKLCEMADYHTSSPKTERQIFESSQSFALPKISTVIEGSDPIFDEFEGYGERIDVDGILTYIGRKITNDKLSFDQRLDLITTSRKFYDDNKFCTPRLWPEFTQWMEQNGYFEKDGNGFSPTVKLLNVAADYVTVT